MKPDGAPKGPIQRIRERIDPQTKDRVSSSLEKTENLLQKMQDKKMTKLHLAKAMMDNELPFGFIQQYLTYGTEYFFEENEFNIDPSQIEALIEGFDFEKDGENKLEEI